MIYLEWTHSSPWKGVIWCQHSSMRADGPEASNIRYWGLTSILRQPAILWIQPSISPKLWSGESMWKTQRSSSAIRLSKSSLASSGHKEKTINIYVSKLTAQVVAFCEFTRFEFGFSQQWGLERAVDVESNLTTMQNNRCWVARNGKSISSRDIMEHDAALDTARVQQRRQPGHSSHSQSACVELIGSHSKVLLASFGCRLWDGAGRGKGGGRGGGGGWWRAGLREPEHLALGLDDLRCWALTRLYQDG